MNLFIERRGKGEAAKWLVDRAGYEGDDCLIWPFSTMPNGYGALGYCGRQYYAHRFICALAHGECPPEHEAAHSCNNRACCNPRHLSWKTRSGNQLDRRTHGTVYRPARGRLGKLSPAERDMIVLLKPHATQREIAALFGVTFQSVSYIHRTRARAINAEKAEP